MIGGENKNLLVFQHGLYNFPQKDLKRINDQGKVKFYIFFLPSERLGEYKTVLSTIVGV